MSRIVSGRRGDMFTDSDPSALAEGRAEGWARYRVMRRSHVSRATLQNIYSPPGALVHDGSGLAVLLKSRDGTGTSTRVDDRAQSTPPGYQIAYECLVRVDESSVPDPDSMGPYSKEAMTLFDY
ncbi:hypothetical protein ACHAW5_001947 [Stephanodiscus triporus]|uniref:Uncharacterized protein n=1 Tax=Stephanodiscus triporus TaxID=2934178 RepID=A0ABD3MCW6_9STRA